MTSKCRECNTVNISLYGRIVRQELNKAKQNFKLKRQNEEEKNKALQEQIRKQEQEK